MFNKKKMREFRFWCMSCRFWFMSRKFVFGACLVIFGLCRKIHFWLMSQKFVFGACHPNLTRTWSLSKMTKQRKGLGCFVPPLMSFDQFATIRLFLVFFLLSWSLFQNVLLAPATRLATQRVQMTRRENVMNLYNSLDCSHKKSDVV